MQCREQRAVGGAPPVLHHTPSCRVHCWCVWTAAHSGVQCSPACVHSSHWSHQHSMTATRRAATRLTLSGTEAGPTLPHSTLVHVQVTECSTATDTHAAGAQDGSQSALTAGPNPTHMDPAQHTQHIIRTETAVCAHERGSGTRHHDSRHVMSAARTEGAAPNTIRPSTQPFIQYCGSIVNRPTPYTQRECHTFPTAQLPEGITHQVVAGS